MCDEIGIPIDANRLSEAVHRANVMLAPSAPARDPTPYSQTHVDEFWTRYHRIVLAGSSPAPEAPDAAEFVYRRFASALGWRIYDDVRPLVRELRARGLKLGIISNWTGDLEDVLRSIDLHDPFDVILDSARFGFEKPHREIFEEALRLAGVAPEHALHVGDSIPHDVDGALGSGLRPVLIDRDGRYATFDRAPRVAALSDLLDLL